MSDHEFDFTDETFAVRANDPDAERALLAACIESKTARVEARKHITGRDFFEPVNEAIWEAMSRLDRHGKDVGLVSVKSVLAGDKTAVRVLIELVGGVGIPDHAGTYAEIIRGWATRRRIESAARQALQRALSPDVNPVGLAASVASSFAAIRDNGTTEDDFTACTLAELLAEDDDEPEWLIPGLLERRDRFMLTGEEGLGKSHLLRQFAIHAAAGLHPFDSGTPIPAIRTLIVDCENTWSQVRRKARPMAEWAARFGQDPTERMMVDCTSRMDITRDKDLARIHQLLDVWAPDLVVIGPLYRLVPRALQTDDDTAPVLAALDTIRDRGCALLMEAHAGHAIGKGGTRDLRPRGSSSLLGWPEFGFGMKSIGAEGYADLVHWRGAREQRQWPQRFRRGDGFRWVPHDDVYDYGGHVA
ncbi:AAA family ATPase [Nocardioides aromaticivorans]|nr:AAA family ATPase [Nocardioides aromaticivorans]